MIHSVPVLLLLLAGSGCAALIYEVVWFQLLQLVIGSSAVSLGLLLAFYMGGLCIGSAALPRLISSARHPLRVFAFIELGIGGLGIATLFVLPWAGRVYAAGLGSGASGVMLRGAVAAACLLPPTILMGASFPAIARWLKTTRNGISWLGLLYSANIAGAVIGCMLAGFYLLRIFDMAAAIYVAAALNLAVSLIAFAAAAVYARPADDTVADYRPPLQRNAFVYIALALSGLTALGAEVVWTRLLSLLLGATTYTFSIILAVFLLGLWAGSAAGSFWARRIGEPRLGLAACQLLLALAVAETAYTLTYLLPYWPVDPWLSRNPVFNFDLDIVRCIRTIFPATLLWGASFPLALAAVSHEKQDSGRLSGELYAANTAGSIVGALVFSLVLIPGLGTRGSQQLLISIAVASAVIAGIPVLVTKRRWFLVAGTLGVAVATAVVLAGTVADVPWQAIAYGRRVAPILRGLDLSSEAEPLFVGEGINSSVVITDRAGQRFFYVSGKSEASSALLDMRLQRMMGHLPALIHPTPRSVLVVGFGAGVTAGSFVPYPEVERIVICELESIIPPASNKYFAAQNNRVIQDYRARVVYDDARHFIFTTPDKFDVITTDPIHPWVKGTSALYSKEYFELVRRHLQPGGVAAQWLPLYESDEETVKTQLATFFSVFPNASVWSNYLNGDGYDLVLIGNTGDAASINLDQLQQRFSAAGYSRVAASLTEVGFESAYDLMATFAGRASDLAPMLANSELNLDRNMRLQYIAGLGLNAVQSSRIYRKVISYRTFPEGFLTGSGERMEALRELLGRPYREF